MGCALSQQNSKEIYDKFNFNPENLGIKCWKLYDHFGDPYEGVLTEETDGAPRIYRIGHRRQVKCAESQVKEYDLWHDKQLEALFEDSKTTMLDDMRCAPSAQIVSLAYISERAASHAKAKSGARNGVSNSNAPATKLSLPKAARNYPGSASPSLETL